MRPWLYSTQLSSDNRFGFSTEEPVQQLYSEILKRLDDSNDIVRKTACQTFATFLKTAPKKHLQGPIIDYALDCLFVHLDDSEPEIQVNTMS